MPQSKKQPPDLKVDKTTEQSDLKVDEIIDTDEEDWLELEEVEFYMEDIPGYGEQDE